LSLTEQSLSLTEQSLSLTEQSLSLTEQLNLLQQQSLLAEPSLLLVCTDQSLEEPTQNHPATPKVPPQPTIGQQTAAPNAPQSHQQPTRTRQQSKQTSIRQFLAYDTHQQQTSQAPVKS
jgi:hypothetical protein